MASSTLAQAPRQPEWKLILDAHPENQLCGTQKKILRASTLMNDLYEEFKDDQVNDIVSLLKILAGWLEMFDLGYAGSTVKAVYYDKDKALHNEQYYPHFANNRMSIFNIVRRNPLEAPYTPGEMPFVLSTITGNLHAQIISAVATLGRNDNQTSNSITDVLTGLKNMGAKHYASLGPTFAQLKALGADTFLLNIGSKLTIDDIEFWSQSVMYTSFVVNARVSSKPQSEILNALDAAISFFNLLERRPHHYLLCVARVMLKSIVSMTSNEALPTYLQSLGQDAVRQIIQKRLEIINFADRLFKNEYLAAKAAVPADPALVMYTALYYCQFVICYQRSEEYPRNLSYLQEARVAYSQCKQWLPPAFYRRINYEISFLEKRKDALEHISSGKHASAQFRADLPMLIYTFDNAPSVKEQCQACRVDGKEYPLFKCKCKKVYYCSNECQNKDWKNHKKECKRVNGA